MNAIILAGGKSLRFGSNKALAIIDGLAIIERIVKVIRPIFEDIIIITNSPEDFDFLVNVKMFPDVIKDKGPLSGIYSGLSNSNALYNFFFAADMPFINTDIVKYMMRQQQDYDGVVPYIKDKYEPLFAVYSKNCLNVIKEQIDEEKYKVSELLSKIKIKKIKEEELKKIDIEFKSFFNVNTQKDYLNAKRVERK